MSVDVQIVLRHVNTGVAYLWNPPCDSWVSSFASVFYVMALIVVSPVIILFALDFTSYAIVRTLGIEHAHPASSKSPELLSSISSSKLSHTNRPSNISIPPPTIMLERPQEYFTTPGGANLAGVGLFSPPQSRTPSPPITRKSTKENVNSRHNVVSNAGATASLGTIIDTIHSEDKGVEGAPPSREALIEESSNVSAAANGGFGHARNDSSDDGDGTLSQVTLRRRKTGMVTPPDT